MSAHKPSRDEAPNDAPTHADTGVPAQPAEPVAEVGEIGGRDSGLDPTRYGDWEKNGRCIDF